MMAHGANIAGKVMIKAPKSACYRKSKYARHKDKEDLNVLR